jgi:hypothetical protein
MNNIIIGISGKIGGGKDTVAHFIMQHDSSFKQKAFAYKLKKIVALLAGVDFDLTLTQEGKNVYVEQFGKTIGEMLQGVGTDGLRDNFDKNVWINGLLTDLKPGNNYVITDVRFKNEADVLKQKGAILVRVNRPNNPVAEKSGRDLTHPSETDLDDYLGFNAVIENSGTLDDLEYAVVKLLENISKGAI